MLDKIVIIAKIVAVKDIHVFDGACQTTLSPSFPLTFTGEVERWLLLILRPLYASETKCDGNDGKFFTVRAGISIGCNAFIEIHGYETLHISGPDRFRQASRR